MTPERSGAGAAEPLVSVPVQRYTSTEYASREWERMWTKVWLLAAHVSELPAPGSFVVVELGRESIVLQRDAAGSVHAFFNVCQHRGFRLVGKTCGHHAELRCKYHQWSWALDGTLRRTPGVELPQDIRESLCLPSVRVVERLGFYWIALSDDVADIDTWLAPIAEGIAARHPQELVLESHSETLLNCNWKTSCDVSNESYHLASVHPGLGKWAKLNEIRTVLLGPHSTTIVPLTDAALPETVKVQFQIFPHVQLNFSGGRLELYRHRPHGDDPARMYFDILSFVAPERMTRSEPLRKRLREGEQSLGSTMDEDLALLPELQHGMASFGCRALRFTSRESAIANFHRVLESFVGPDDVATVGN